MSEYQYYEFAAIDRPLTEKEVSELRKLSSRAEITPTSFRNVYHFGNFRGDPKKMMEKYFDFFVYVANWGSRCSMIRVPKRVLDRKQLKPYIDGEVVSLRQANDNIIVTFDAELEEPPHDWEEGERWLPLLRPVRDALMTGDLRPFYLGWLRAAEQGLLDDDAVEPPVPPGLGKPDGAIQALVDFLCVDTDLIVAAAGAADGTDPAGPSQRDFAAWVATLDDRHKNAWLLDLLAGQGAKARAEALQAFRKSKAKGGASEQSSCTTPRRTAAELLAAAESLRAERSVRKRQRAEKFRAEARKKHLDQLAAREAAAWREVDALLSATTAKKHQSAVALLTDLREVAARRGRVAEAQRRIDQFRERFARRHSLMRRFREAGL
ncbi:MAG TPA: hypothetical protein VHC22_27090 [Pirellulales bacterium]|nr:hypothetical protein [Pirellulales bacterium]